MNTYDQTELLKDLPKKQNGQISDRLAKLPPQSSEAEEAVLGSVMMEKTAIHLATQILSTSDFYSEKNQQIYAAFLELFNERKAIDQITVKNKLSALGKLDFVGGPMALLGLTKAIASTANLETHARIVKQKSIARQLISITSNALEKAWNDVDDVFTLINDVQSEILSISRDNSKSGTRSIGEIVTEVVADIDKTRTSENKIIGLPSGIDALDKVTSGFQPGDLIIVAARPGMGKSSLARSIAKNVAVSQKRPTAIFSMEEKDKKVVLAMFSMQTGIENTHLKNANLKEQEWHLLHNATSTLGNAPMDIDDTPGLNHMEFRAKVLGLKAKNPELALVVVDYLQLMSASGKKQKQNREQEISEISRNIKLVAMETGVPIIALSQLSRAVEQRGGTKRPILSDLRESGSIEQDADVVIFVYRPDYYGYNEQDAKLTGKGELIVAKNRNGATNTAIVAFDEKTTLFRDLNYSESLEPNY